VRDPSTHQNTDSPRTTKHQHCERPLYALWSSKQACYLLRRLTRAFLPRSCAQKRAKPPVVTVVPCAEKRATQRMQFRVGVPSRSRDYSAFKRGRRAQKGRKVENTTRRDIDVTGRQLSHETSIASCPLLYRRSDGAARSKPVSRYYRDSSELLAYAAYVCLLTR
jgi:hypothetical protein